MRAAGELDEFSRSQTGSSKANSSMPTPRERRTGDADGMGPRDEQEAVAWAEADDLAQGALLFEPLVNFVLQREDIMRAGLA